ncbi:hypothetical protein SDC9_61286 [bioreactor metagenome]|uniref:Rod shape-determining protein MreD n=1 Tax=bioreactor metagenome TaxID=1076179 RepID=A0A644XFD6_9ZZZZ
MTPRQETIYKWGLYALVTLLCCVLQGLVLQYVKVLGVFPFLYPILAAVLSTLEGPLAGMIYSLALGVVCDLTISAPIPCFYTLIFPLAGLLAGTLARSVLSSGFLSALVTSAAAFLLTGAFYGLIFVLVSRPAWEETVSVCGRELAVSIPLVLPVYFLFRFVWRRCLDDQRTRS